MTTLRMHFHPGVLPRRDGMWRQRARSAHLRQGSLDDACGVHAVWMALIVLGVVSHAQLRGLRVPGDAHLRETWDQGTQTFFSGATDAEMNALLTTADDHIRHHTVSGSMRKVLDFTQARLAKSEVVILGLDNTSVHGGHWVLAVGMMQMQEARTKKPLALLCLDSTLPAPALASFNARLDLDSPSRGARYLHYRTADGGIQSVTCKTAIALSRR